MHLFERVDSRTALPYFIAVEPPVPDGFFTPEVTLSV